MLQGDFATNNRPRLGAYGPFARVRISCGYPPIEIYGPTSHQGPTPNWGSLHHKFCWEEKIVWGSTKYELVFYTHSQKIDNSPHRYKESNRGSSLVSFCHTIFFTWDAGCNEGKMTGRKLPVIPRENVFTKVSIIARVPIQGQDRKTLFPEPVSYPPFFPEKKVERQGGGILPGLLIWEGHTWAAMSTT